MFCIYDFFWEDLDQHQKRCAIHKNVEISIGFLSNDNLPPLIWISVGSTTTYLVHCENKTKLAFIELASFVNNELSRCCFIMSNKNKLTKIKRTTKFKYFLHLHLISWKIWINNKRDLKFI